MKTHHGKIDICSTIIGSIAGMLTAQWLSANYGIPGDPFSLYFVACIVYCAVLGLTASGAIALLFGNSLPPTWNLWFGTSIGLLLPEACERTAISILGWDRIAYGIATTTFLLRLVSPFAGLTAGAVLCHRGMQMQVRSRFFGVVATLIAATGFSLLWYLHGIGATVISPAPSREEALIAGTINGATLVLLGCLIGTEATGAKIGFAVIANAATQNRKWGH